MEMDNFYHGAARCSDGKFCSKFFTHFFEHFCAYLGLHSASHPDLGIIGAKVASGAYSKALQAAKSSERTMMDLAWSAVGFVELVKKVRSFQVEVNAFVQQGGDGGGATPNLGLMKSNLLSYLKDLFSKKRIAASHLLVL